MKWLQATRAQTLYVEKVRARDEPPCSQHFCQNLFISKGQGAEDSGVQIFEDMQNIEHYLATFAVTGVVVAIFPANLYTFHPLHRTTSRVHNVSTKFSSTLCGFGWCAVDRCGIFNEMQ